MAEKVAFTLYAETEQARRDAERFFREFEGNVNRVKQPAQDVGNVLEEGVGKIQKWATGALSVAGAWQLVGKGIQIARDALEDYRRLEQQGVESIRTKEEGMRRFVGLGGTAQDIQARQDLAERIQKTQGIQDITRAQQFVFDMESLGSAPQDTERLANVFKLGSQGQQISTGAVELSKSFRAENIAPQDMVDRIILAAQQSKVTPEQFAPLVKRVAPTANLIGANADETLAVLSQVVGMSATPEIGATQMAAYTDAVQRLKEKGSIKGEGGFLATAKEIQAAGLGNITGLGSNEAQKGFLNILSSQQDIRRIQGGLGRADQADVLGEILTAGNTAFPELGMIEDVNRSETEKKDALENLAAGKFGREAAYNRYVAGQNFGNWNMLGGYGGRSAAGLARDLPGFRPDLVSTAGRAGEMLVPAAVDLLNPLAGLTNSAFQASRPILSEGQPGAPAGAPLPAATPAPGARPQDEFVDMMDRLRASLDANTRATRDNTDGAATSEPGTEYANNYAGGGG